MSVQMIEVGGSYAVFGLSWRPLDDPDQERAEAKLLAKDFDAVYQVRAVAANAPGGEVLYGLLSKDALQEHGIKRGKAKLVSPSVLLTTLPNVSPNSIWAERDGKLAYMAVLENGIPYPGGDFCGAPEDVQAACESILSQSNANFHFYGNLQRDGIPLSLSALFEEGNQKAATLNPASKGVDSRVIAVVLLVAAIGAGYWYMQFKAEQEKAARLAARQKQMSPQQLYAKSLAAALMTSGAPVSTTLPLIVENAFQQELLEGGWLLSKIACDAAACQYSWANVGGTNLSLRDALGGRSIDYALDGASASYVIQHKGTNLAPLDATKLPTMTQFKERVGSFSQDVKLLGVTSAFGPEAIFGADPTVSAAAIKSPVKAGTFSYQGNAALLQEIMSRLPANMTLKQLVITPGTDARFNLEGIYYVKD